MTDDKVIEALTKLREITTRISESPEVQPKRLSEECLGYLAGNIPPAQLEAHLLFMCEEAILLVKSGRKEKAMRWLGFIQGALWMHELAFVSIDDLKNLNKPDCPICKGLGFRNNDECDDCSCVKKQ